jgi:outer membrane protein OmpA-like peptidoglycan-associated protein
MKSMKRNLFLSLLLLVSLQVNAQTTFWNQFYGGSGYDMGRKVLLKDDGTIILAGEVYSNDGLGKGNHGEIGSSDVTIFRFATQGVMFWETLLGGTGDESISDLVETLDGGYLMIGTTDSRENTLGSAYGGSDVWVVRLDAKGAVVWSKRFGGRGNDQGLTAVALPDGYFYIAGESGSKDGSMRGRHHGGLDGWLAKLDADGNLIWQQFYGGSGDEQIIGAYILSNYECIVVGSTSSSDYDVSKNLGKKDAWIFKIGEFGQLLEEQTFGGSDIDEVHKSARDARGNIYLAGTTFSNNGHIPFQHGKGDFWVMKIDAAKNVLWSKTFGGSRPDGANDLFLTQDGGVVVCGTARSSDGDILLTRGYYDGFVVKMDEFGNKQWSRNYGYYGKDDITSILEVPKGGYLAVGYMDEPTLERPIPGDTIDPHSYLDFPKHKGGYDFWLINFSDPAKNITRPYITPPLLSGSTLDDFNGNPIEAMITLVDNNTLDSITSTNSDAQYGNFDMLMPAYGLVSIKVLAKGYLFYGEDLSMDTVISKARIKRDIRLEPIQIGSSLILERIYFNSGRWNILPPSRAELARLVDFLNLNPTVRIEISGHTDNTGNRAQKVQLSEYRASAVRDYLIEQGIDANRLRAIGEGLKRPIASNNTSEGRRKNRRVEFKVIGM